MHMLELRLMRRLIRKAMFFYGTITNLIGIYYTFHSVALGIRRGLNGVQHKYAETESDLFFLLLFSISVHTIIHS